MSVDEIVCSSSFNKLYQQYRDPFIRVAFSYINDEYIAEDFVTDAFVAYWENRNNLSEDVNAPAYIFVSVKNKCLTYLNRLRKEEEIKGNIKNQQEWELELQISSLDACDPQAMFTEEIQMLVNDAISSLPDKTREIFQMSRLDMLTNREIAEQLDISVKTVEFHISKALRIMRVALKDYLPVFFYLFLK